MKSISREELGQENGAKGRSAWIAVDAHVYDVSVSKRWPGGTHMKRHQAGSDLTLDIQAAPHGREVLERFAVVGLLEEAPRELAGGVRDRVDTVLEAHPFFRRHPHPAVVHVPVGMFTVVPIFQLLALALNSSATEWTAFCMVLAGTLSMPAAIATGYFTWWINYALSDTVIIARKRRLAWTSLVLAVGACMFRWYAVTDPVSLGSLSAIVYSVVILLLSGMVGYIGFLGGKLTFPYESK
ncbi:MAG TPA: cytochrome b5 domain-containing protein [Desulfomonilaceae bacterium]|nr:cytochrome b5 domain-containing protein [Desulfomonilaceae bacterium]